MVSIITGSILLSVLHAVIPNHWLPILAIAKKENWTIDEVTKVTLITALAHALSTILIGAGLGFLGSEMAKHISQLTPIISSLILIIMGLVFIYRHHRHQHFHVDGDLKKKSKNRIILALVLAMFFSPCMEIEAYFLLAGTHAKWLVVFIAFAYLLITITGMTLLVRFAYKGVLKLNWHSLEHNAGIISGIVLVTTGLLTLFIH